MVKRNRKSLKRLIGSREDEESASSKFKTNVKSKNTVLCISSKTPHQVQNQKLNQNQKQRRNLHTSSFELPDDWLVEEHPRSSRPQHIDKYYIEPGSGKKFRSLVSVQRYLNEDADQVPMKAVRWRPKSLKNGQKVARILGDSSSKFDLPKGWLVKEKPRKNVNYAGRIDKEYIEPGTEKKFRSLLSVQKHLMQEDNLALTQKEERPVYRKNIQMIALHSTSCLVSNLPDCWIVEEWPCDDPRYEGVINRYYIEPGTGKRFRSLVAVNSYLSGGGGLSSSVEPRDHQLNPPENSGSRKNRTSDKEDQKSVRDLSAPPCKVKWVLGCPGGNIWNPMVNDSCVPELIKEKWSEAFILSLSNNSNASDLEGSSRE